MKKVLTSFLALLLVLQIFSIAVLADESVAPEESEVTREEVLKERPAITPREATISMLLDAGWTMEEINDWYTEEMLLEMDQNTKAISNTAVYTVNYEDAATEEMTSEELTRQEFDYRVNQKQCGEEDHDQTELKNLSSNGLLELQPIYDWEAMNDVTADDRLYFGYEGYSGASIWNADSSCYLKQNMGLEWLGNDTYNVQYRFEWMTEPYYKLTDHFAIFPADDLISHDSPREAFIFKYNLMGTEYVETLSSTSCCKMQYVSMNEGRQMRINYPKAAQDIVSSKLRGFFTYFLQINKRYSSQRFIVYAQYFHGKVSVNASASISFSISGANVSFSISPSKNYTAESHPMSVRAFNPYMN